MKRVNLDQTGVRTDFLKAGTMAKGSAETGKVRGWLFGFRLFPAISSGVFVCWQADSLVRCALKCFKPVPQRRDGR